MRMNLCEAGRSAGRSAGRRRFQYLLEKHVGLHAMRRVMRAGVYAAGLGLIAAEVAGRGLLLRHLGALAGRSGLRHLERMDRDVAVRTIIGAQAAADTPVFDNDFERLPPPDGAYWAADHAQRVAALAAGCG